MTRRLVLSYAGVTVFVLLLLEIPLAILFQQREIDQLSTDAERDATVLATIYEDALEAGTTLDPGPAEDYSVDTAARVVVVDSQGISLIDTERPPSRDFSTRPEFEIALTGQRSVGTRFSETLNTDLLYVAVPVASGGTVHGALRLTLDTHEVDEHVQRFWLGLAGVALVIVAAVSLIGWTIARWATRPVRHLQATAARFSSGDLTQTEPDPRSPSELLALEHTMNTMAGRLEDLIDQQRGFVSDVSHQLRTPLTGLRLRLENLRDESTDPDHQNQLDRVITEAERLSTLVGDVLHLGKVETAPAPTPTAQDLSQLIRDRVDTWTAVAEQARVDLIALVPDAPVAALALPGSIEQILDNLIDNAIAASDERSAVKVSVCALGGQRAKETVRLAVSDNGPGLPDDQKAAALERFWKADSATSGSGLGLAIVKKLAEQCGGRVELSDNQPAGLTVSVYLTPTTLP